VSGLRPLIEKIRRMSTALRAFWAEAKRRKVHRAALAYAIVGVGVLEGADLILPALDVPEWTYRLAVGLVLAQRANIEEARSVLAEVIDESRELRQPGLEARGWLTLAQT